MKGSEGGEGSKGGKGSKGGVKGSIRGRRGVKVIFYTRFIRVSTTWNLKKV